MLNLNNLLEPHLGENIFYAGEKLEDAKFAMILIHGRGGTAASMMSLVDELDLKDTIVIVPQADQFTWYPYRFIEKREVNEPGISSGLRLIDSIIVKLNHSGISSENIFLLGFSQGACLMLDYAARHPKKYAGVFVLSGGLIGDKLNSDDYGGSLDRTPVFFGCSDNDFHIPESRVHESAEIIKKMNADAEVRIYKNMGHTITRDEIDLIKKMIDYSTKQNSSKSFKHIT
jgi:predicted esterase